MKTLKFQNITAALMENSQENPIRWAMCKEVSPDVLVNTTPIFKCRDYFNDFVAKKHLKKLFEVYGMNSDWASFDEQGGAYVLVANLKPKFLENLDNFVNVLLKKNWGFVIKPEDVTVEALDKAPVRLTKAKLLYFPNEVFTSNYRVSLITLLIRMANQGFPVTPELLAAPTTSFHTFHERMIEGPAWQFLQKGNYVLKDEPVNRVGMYANDAYVLHNNGWIGYLKTASYNNGTLVPFDQLVVA